MKRRTYGSIFLAVCLLLAAMAADAHENATTTSTSPPSSIGAESGLQNVDIVPNDLIVRIYSHSISLSSGNKDAWSYVSDGLQTTEEPVAIGADGSDASKVSGSFLVLCTQQKKDEFQGIKDGFSLLLTDDSCKKLRDAMLTGSPCSLALKDDDVSSVSLEWK